VNRSNGPERETHPIPWLQTSKSCGHALKPSQVRLQNALSHCVSFWYPEGHMVEGVITPKFTLDCN
jgi:hypothetical protein